MLFSIGQSSKMYDFEFTRCIGFTEVRMVAKGTGGQEVIVHIFVD